MNDFKEEIEVSNVGVKKDRIKELVAELNKYRDYYYNNNVSLVEDIEYDNLFDELEQLEKETNFILMNSPTQTVGYMIQDKLQKVTHSHPMLSLGKTKNVEDIVRFLNKKDGVAMLKEDGLTCSIHYDSNGNFVSAETRGNGEVGEDVTENAKFITNLPKKINVTSPFTIDGEVIIDKDTFNEINSELDEPYSHPRNLASGSIRQLDTSFTAKRKLKFIAWRIIEGESSVGSFYKSLSFAEILGFDVVPHIYIPSDCEKDEINKNIEQLKEIAEEKRHPIDGIVFTFDDIKYGLSLGMTGHHPQHSKAFKFYDETYETILRNVEWSVSRTGQVNPVAVFDPVEIDGTIIQRATLHNVSIMKKLELGIGDTITVYKSNQIIPKVDDNLTRSNTYIFPKYCPCCKEKLVMKEDGIAQVLYCENPKCASKILFKFSHFVSKEGMNIDGLSEATLQKFIESGFIKNYQDIYHLDRYKEKIVTMDGFGEKAYSNLISSINNSRKVKLSNFLIALGIPLIGKSAAKEIENYFNGNYQNLIKQGKNFDFTILKDFGSTMHESMINWLNSTDEIESNVEQELEFIYEEKKIIKNDFINGKTFCVTGKFNAMKRSEIEEIITSRNGKLVSSVSKKTDYLLTNDGDSGSSKSKKAKELGIPVVSEDDFKKLI